MMEGKVVKGGLRHFTQILFIISLGCHWSGKKKKKTQKSQIQRKNIELPLKLTDDLFK